MIIQIDTREKPEKNKHITKYLDEHDIKYVRSKCVVGDYVNLENPMVVIDRKKDLQEVSGNVTKQHERFVKEMVLAKELGYKMIVLIEEPNIRSLDEVPTWYNYRIKNSPNALNGKKLYKIMKTMGEKYDIIWDFTTKKTCAKKIISLLKKR